MAGSFMDSRRVTRLTSAVPVLGIHVSLHFRTLRLEETHFRWRFSICDTHDGDVLLTFGWSAPGGTVPSLCIFSPVPGSCPARLNSVSHCPRIRDCRCHFSVSQVVAVLGRALIFDLQRNICSPSSTGCLQSIFDETSSVHVLEEVSRTFLRAPLRLRGRLLCRSTCPLGFPAPLQLRPWHRDHMWGGMVQAARSCWTLPCVTVHVIMVKVHFGGSAMTWFRRGADGIFKLRVELHRFLSCTPWSLPRGRLVWLADVTCRCFPAASA